MLYACARISMLYSPFINLRIHPKNPSYHVSTIIITLQRVPCINNRDLLNLYSVTDTLMPTCYTNIMADTISYGKICLTGRFPWKLLQYPRMVFQTIWLSIPMYFFQACILCSDSNSWQADMKIHYHAQLKLYTGLPSEKSKVLEFQICCARTKYLSRYIKTGL